MSTKIFVNQPVKNLNNFKAFGWTFNPQFADETAASLVISEDIYAMLLTHHKYAGFTDKKIADGTTAEALIAIAVDSKAEVDRIANAALKAGAQEAKPRRDPELSFRAARRPPGPALRQPRAGALKEHRLPETGLPYTKHPGTITFAPPGSVPAVRQHKGFEIILCALEPAFRTTCHGNAVA